jgi:putative phosphoesterase
MRIAAISDIHGDYQSLTAVWQDIEDRGLNQMPVLNAGDTVAYGHSTMACVDFVRDASHGIISVSGNYDVNSARFPAKEDSYRRKWGKLRPDKLGALRDASDDLTTDARNWLLTIPTATTIELGGARISLSHYAPTTDKEGLFADTSETRLSQIAAEIDGSFDIVIVGHTHSAFARRVGDVLFVNPGAVGRSFGSPTYAEIDVEPDTDSKARIVSCRVLQR